MGRAEAHTYLSEGESQTGFVKWFSKEKGYGFIAIDNGQGDVFLHRNNASFDPAENDKVSFTVVEDKRRKRIYAVDVTLA